MSASHVRVLSAAVQALATVGKEISFSVDAVPERHAGGNALVLSTLNDSASSYASFRFEQRFFGRTRVRDSPRLLFRCTLA